MGELTGRETSHPILFSIEVRIIGVQVLEIKSGVEESSELWMRVVVAP